MSGISSIIIHYVTPDVRGANGQVKCYIRAIMNFTEIGTRIKKDCSSVLGTVQLVLNTTIKNQLH